MTIRNTPPAENAHTMGPLYPSDTEPKKPAKAKPSAAKDAKRRETRDALAQAVSDLERQIAHDKTELESHVAIVKNSTEETKRYKKKVAAQEKDLKSKKKKLKGLL